MFCFLLLAGSMILLFVARSAEASESVVVIDEPMILMEVQGTRDSIVTGVYGDEAVNLYRYHGPRGDQTLGTVGDQVILIDHVPERHFQMRVPMEVNLYESETESFSTLPPYTWESLEELPDLQPEEE